MWLLGGMQGGETRFHLAVLFMAYISAALAWKKVTPTHVEYNARPDMCKSSRFLTVPAGVVRLKISEHENKVLWASGG